MELYNRRIIAALFAKRNAVVPAQQGREKVFPGSVLRIESGNIFCVQKWVP